MMVGLVAFNSVMRYLVWTAIRFDTVELREPEEDLHSRVVDRRNQLHSRP